MFWFCLLYAGKQTRIAYAVLWIGMGVSLEYAQGLLAYRTFDVDDMIANAIGVLLGWALSFAVPAGLARKLR